MTVTGAIVLVSLVIFVVGAKLAMLRGLLPLASYLMYRWTHRLDTPLAAFLNERDRMLAIPVVVAEEQLAILHRFSLRPEVIAAAKKTLRQVRRAHEADCEHIPRWHCPSHGDVRCAQCGKVYSSGCGRCGIVKLARVEAS